MDNVRRGIGSDARIGAAFLFPGPGYGGSCFPKDLKALLHTAAAHGVPLRVIEGADQTNDRQKQVLFERVQTALGGSVTGRRIAVWGLAFKARTDDLRESPALTLIDALLEAGAYVTAHDLVAMPAARLQLGECITFAATGYDALTDADALVVATDWNEYRHPDFARVLGALAAPIVVDGRNLYSPEKMAGTRSGAGSAFLRPALRRTTPAARTTGARRGGTPRSSAPCRVLATT